MNLAKLLAPRDPQLQQLAKDLYAEREDLRQAFPDPVGAEYSSWLGSHGVLAYETIAAHYPALPPEGLRATACGGLGLESHLMTGVADFRTVGELFEVFSGRSIESLRSVLDFGCGCGRLLRWFHTALPECQLLGADVREATAKWCGDHLPGTFLYNGTEPPLDLPDESAELTVALSVFSHLSREQSLPWMKELVRVTKKDGLILVSTHGAFALAVTMRSLEHQRGLKIPGDEVPELLRNLCRDGFLHRVSPAETLGRADGVSDDYGETFLTERFAREQWGTVAEVLGCVPVALNLFQDVFALRPKRGG